MPPPKQEMKGEVRELKQIGSTAAAKIGSQHTRTAILKSTNTDVTPPKRKHINYLLDYMSQGGSVDKVANLLSERTREKNWVVAFKALSVYHTLMKESNREFMRCLASRPTNFRHMNNYLDKLNNEGFGMSWFIRKYAAYLEEKVAVFRQHSIDYVSRNTTEDFSSLTDKKLCEVIKALQGQSAVLLSVQIPYEDVTNTVLRHAYLMLMKEFIRLYLAVNTGVIAILDRFFKMPKDDALLGLRIYEQFVKDISSVSSFLLIGTKMDSTMKTEIPALKIPPENVIEALRAHVGAEAPTPTTYSGSTALTSTKSVGAGNSQLLPRTSNAFKSIYKGQTSSDAQSLTRSSADDTGIPQVAQPPQQPMPEVNLLDLDYGPPLEAVPQISQVPNASPIDIFDPLSTNTTTSQLQTAPVLGYGSNRQMYSAPVQSQNLFGSEGYAQGGQMPMGMTNFTASVDNSMVGKMMGNGGMGMASMNNAYKGLPPQQQWGTMQSTHSAPVQQSITYFSGTKSSQQTTERIYRNDQHQNQPNNGIQQHDTNPFGVATPSATQSTNPFM
eukprot:CFRG1552T1